MRIFRSISVVAALVLLCTLLCSIEIEADSVHDEGQLPDLALSHHNAKNGDNLGVETMVVDSEETDKGVMNFLAELVIITLIKKSFSFNFLIK